MRVKADGDPLGALGDVGWWVLQEGGTGCAQTRPSVYNLADVTQHGARFCGRLRGLRVTNWLSLGMTSVVTHTLHSPPPKSLKPL